LFLCLPNLPPPYLSGALPYLRSSFARPEGASLVAEGGREAGGNSLPSLPPSFAALWTIGSASSPSLRSGPRSRRS
jgi:hypothetical protein